MNVAQRWVFGLSLILFFATHAAALEQALPQSSYRIGPNDVIRIQVFGEEDLTVESRVEGDGKINYPLLGILQVGGWTTEGLQKELTSRLAAGYVRRPRVTVSIVRHRNIFVRHTIVARVDPSLSQFVRYEGDFFILIVVDAFDLDRPALSTGR